MNFPNLRPKIYLVALMAATGSLTSIQGAAAPESLRPIPALQGSSLPMDVIWHEHSIALIATREPVATEIVGPALDHAQDVFIRHFGPPAEGRGLLYDRALIDHRPGGAAITHSWTLPWGLDDMRKMEPSASRGDMPFDQDMAQKFLKISQDPDALDAFLLEEAERQMPGVVAELDDAGKKQLLENMRAGFRKRETELRAQAEQVLAGDGIEPGETNGAIHADLQQAVGHLAHEIGHKLFIATIWGSNRSGQYGGDAPDWLDEAAAILMETESLAQVRREQFIASVNNKELIPLSQYLLMTHPALERSLVKPRDAATAPERSVSIHTRHLQGQDAQALTIFYAQTRGFVDYLLARTGEDRVFLDIAEHLKAGGSMAAWLRDGPTARRAALPQTLEGLDADFRAWARG